MKRQRREHARRAHRGFNKAMRRGAVAALLLVGAAVDGTVGRAGAEGTCGDYSFNFTDTWLINDGISDSAGPFPIGLPAGTYDVTLVGGDSHSTKDYSDQPGEQWYVNLNNGWQSPLSDDLPDDADLITTSFAAQTVPASTAISVHHAGEGNVNSIEVMCVGFTPVGSAGDDAAADPTEGGTEGMDDDAATMDEEKDEAADEMNDSSEEMEDEPTDGASGEDDDTMIDGADAEPVPDRPDPGSVDEDPVDEAPVDEVVEEDPVDDVVEEDPVDDVVEEDPVDDVVEEAPVAEPVEVDAEPEADGDDDAGAGSEATGEELSPEMLRQRSLYHG